MATGEMQGNVSGMLRTIQIIVLSMTVGSIVFTAVAYFLPAQGPAGQPFLSRVVAPVLVALMVSAAFLVPRMMVLAAHKRLAALAAAGKSEEIPGRLVPVFVTQTIVGAAQVEAACFFLAICFMVEHVPWTILGAVILAALVAFHFPTQERLERWIAVQTEQIAQQAQAKA